MPPAHLPPAAGNVPGSRPRRRVLVVLGMHRGGTSAVAGVLHRLGVNFGPRLMPANADNPSGYYEHNDVVNLHDRFLLRLGAAWDTVFPPEFNAPVWNTLAPAPGLPTYREELLAILQRDFPAPPDAVPPVVGRSAPWGIKDPRLCLLLPWWQPLWEMLGSEPLFLLVLRSPRAVAASLERRNGCSRAKSSLLWLQHLLRAERDTRGCPRYFLNYDEFLDNWRAALRPVVAELGESWPVRLEESDPAAAGFLDPTLRHHGSPSLTAPSGEELSPWLDTIWRVFADRHVNGLPQAGSRILDDLSVEVSHACRLLQPLLQARETDQAAELAAQRKLTRWYEEEWQKANSEARSLKMRLHKPQTKTAKLRD